MTAKKDDADALESDVPMSEPAAGPVFGLEHGASEGDPFALAGIQPTEYHPATPLCSHCGAVLSAHAAKDGPKAGAEHCSRCGCCFGPDGSLRPGHPACRQYTDSQVVKV